ncbi:MAG: NUDIX hydrolase [Oscillospiraceae bacterium]
MNLTEKQVSTKTIYDGCIIKVRVDEVLLPNGEMAKREVVEHNGAVCVVPITDDNMVYMVRQFRYAFNEAMLEVPAGKLNSLDEVWADAAIRELEEETGMKADELIYIGDFCPSVAIITEVIHMYVAKGLHKGEQNLDDDEFLDVEKYPLATLVSMIMSGEIKDGKTIAAILKVNTMQ